MFDIGFWELGLIFLIGLIVLGPERLPKVARTLGLWVRRARGYMQGFTSELEREINADEMREHFRETGRYLGKTQEDFRSGVSDLRNSVESATSGASGNRDHFRRARAAKPPASSGESAVDRSALSGSAEASSSGDSKDSAGESKDRE